MDFILHFVLTPRQAHSTTWSGCVCLNQPATVNWIISHRHCELLYADADVDAADAALWFLQWPIFRAEQKLALSQYLCTHACWLPRSYCLFSLLCSLYLFLCKSGSLSWWFPKGNAATPSVCDQKAFGLYVCRACLDRLTRTLYVYTSNPCELILRHVSVCLPVRVHLLDVRRQ